LGVSTSPTLTSYGVLSPFVKDQVPCILSDWMINIYFRNPGFKSVSISTLDFFQSVFSQIPSIDVACPYESMVIVYFRASSFISVRHVTLGPYLF
jgi:hypothetical protein